MRIAFSKDVRAAEMISPWSLFISETDSAEEDCLMLPCIKSPFLLAQI